MRYTEENFREGGLQMMNPETEEEFWEMADEIGTDSPYKKKDTKKSKMMTVREMGDLLGIKKTDRYWLIKKGYFETKVILGKTWVDTESFEKWYANQVKYKKVTGEEPGKELKKWSYSPLELAEMLDITDGTLYDLLKRENIETVVVDYWKRVPKKAFDDWYAGQTKYRKKEDREKDAAVEAATITMPEMARLLGVTRSVVYSILSSPKYEHFFDTVVIADKKRITKESFQKFLDGQDAYHLDKRNDYKEVAMEENAALADFRRKKLFASGVRKGNGNDQYLTRSEAAMLAKVSQSTITRWADKGHFTVIKAGEVMRISRIEFEDWLEYKKKMEEIDNGNN
jgi:excisionase family DNA binding protein